MDEDLIETAVDALEGLIGQLIEDAHDDAVARAPDSLEARMERLNRLKLRGNDVTALADAAARLLRGLSHDGEGRREIPRLGAGPSTSTG